MHFKEFKAVKNAFYSSAVVTRASQAQIFSGTCFSRARLKIQAFLFFFVWDLVCRTRVPGEDRGNWG